MNEANDLLPLLCVCVSVCAKRLAEKTDKTSLQKCLLVDIGMLVSIGVRSPIAGALELIVSSPRLASYRQSNQGFSAFIPFRQEHVQEIGSDRE